MRALPLDFPNDPNVADMRDEYMFGPAFLVAPVMEQGADQPQGLSARRGRLVQLLDQRAGERRTDDRGGRTDRYDSSLCAGGSILPLGSVVESTHQQQAIEHVRVYPGADAEFTLFSDDGTTYAYEKGAGSITRLHWSDADKRLTHEGAQAWSAPDKAIIEVVGR